MAAALVIIAKLCRHKWRICTEGGGEEVNWWLLQTILASSFQCCCTVCCHLYSLQKARWKYSSVFSGCSEPLRFSDKPKLISSKTVHWWSVTLPLGSNHWVISHDMPQLRFPISESRLGRRLFSINTSPFNLSWLNQIKANFAIQECRYLGYLFCSSRRMRPLSRNHLLPALKFFSASNIKLEIPVRAGSIPPSRLPISRAAAAIPAKMTRLLPPTRIMRRCILPAQLRSATDLCGSITKLCLFVFGNEEKEG